MNQEEKIAFITKLTGSICSELCAKVRDGRIPENSIRADQRQHFETIKTEAGRV